MGCFRFVREGRVGWGLKDHLIEGNSGRLHGVFPVEISGNGPSINSMQIIMNGPRTGARVVKSRERHHGVIASRVSGSPCNLSLRFCRVLIFSSTTPLSFT